jgi:hypothetical protein
VVLVVLAVFVSGCGAATASDLKDREESLTGMAADAHLTAERAQSGALPTNLTQGHAEEIAKQADAEAQKLSSTPTDPSLRECADRLADLAEVLRDASQKLADAPDDRDLAESVAGSLEDLIGRIDCEELG